MIPWAPSGDSEQVERRKETTEAPGCPKRGARAASWPGGGGAAHVQFSPRSGQSLTWGYEGAPTSAVTEATSGCKVQWPGPK